MNITALCLSTTVQRIASFNHLNLDEVNRSSHFRMDASGKAVNLARVLEQLEKGCVEVICPVGQENATQFENLARQDKIKTIPILIPGYTRECLTILEKKTGRITELVMDEPVAKDKKSLECIAIAEKKLIATLEKSFLHSDAFAFAGSRPKIWSENLNAIICKAALAAGLILLVDFWGKDLLSVLRVCTPQIIKINAQEFCATFNIPHIKTDEGVKELQKIICQKSDELQNCIVITCGKDPTHAAYKGNSYICPVEKIHVVNTIGCGDSFSAGFLYEYMRTKNSQELKAQNIDPNIQKALEKGNWCAARNAESEKLGTLG